MPCRIQRKRSKGWRMPAGAIYIGRPSKWGNPYWPGQSTDDFPMWLVGAYGKPTIIVEATAVAVPTPHMNSGETEPEPEA